MPRSRALAFARAAAPWLGAGSFLCAGFSLGLFFAVSQLEVCENTCAITSNVSPAALCGALRACACPVRGNP